MMSVITDEIGGEYSTHSQDNKYTHNVSLQNPKGRYHFEGLGAGGRIIIKWRCKLDSSSKGYGPVVGFCEHGNEHSGSIKGGKLLERVSALWSLLIYFYVIKSSHEEHLMGLR
jgi:hypothetical protein